MRPGDPDLRADEVEAPVELGRFPVHDTGSLTAPGWPFQDLLAQLPDGDRLEAPPAHLAAALPSSGWRVISPSAHGMVVAAAPTSKSTWAVAELDPRTDAEERRSWHIGAHPGPLVTRPGRVIRQRLLRLRLLSDEVTVRPEQQEVRLTAELMNTSQQPWVSDGLDSAFVLVELAGASLTGGVWVFGPKLPTLPGSGSVELDATWRIKPRRRPGPGTHHLTATLISLNLTAPSRLLRVRVSMD